MEAFAALGKIQRVSEGVLLQSLEKKVMKTDRMGVSIINGQKLPPKLKIPCAAGIFSHGVEDEFTRFYHYLVVSFSLKLQLFYCISFTL
jgi:integrator complex subunit 4